MSTRRRSRTARRAARPRIWPSSSLTSRLLTSRWRSMLRSSAPASRTWFSSWSCSRRSRSRSARISSRRRRLASRSEGFWAAAVEAQSRKDAKTQRRKVVSGWRRRRVPHLPTFRLCVFASLDMPQVPPPPRRAPPQPDQGPEGEHQAELLGAEEHQPAGHFAGGVAEDLEGEPAHHDREAPAQHAPERALEQEGAADEAVGGTHQAHDRDLPRALEHGDPDGDADDDDGHDGEREADRSEERRVGKECRSRWSPY